MGLDKKVNISFIEENGDIQEKIIIDLNKISGYEVSTWLTAEENELILSIDGNWYNQDEDLIKLSIKYPAVKFRIETCIYGEDNDYQEYLNGKNIITTKLLVILNLIQDGYEHTHRNLLEVKHGENIDEFLKKYVRNYYDEMNLNDNTYSNGVIGLRGFKSQVITEELYQSLYNLFY